MAVVRVHWGETVRGLFIGDKLVIKWTRQRNAPLK
jgi:hypothetical protein